MLPGWPQISLSLQNNINDWYNEFWIIYNCNYSICKFQIQNTWNFPYLTFFWIIVVRDAIYRADRTVTVPANRAGKAAGPAQRLIVKLMWAAPLDTTSGAGTDVVYQPVISHFLITYQSTLAFNFWRWALPKEAYNDVSRPGLVNWTNIIEKLPVENLRLSSLC